MEKSALTTITVPQSVRDYFSDSTIEAGVDALLSVRVDKLPAELDLDQIARYYRARAAAETVRCEFAHLALDITRKVWREAIPKGYGFDQENSDFLSVEGAWTDKSCWIVYSYRKNLFYTRVVLIEDKWQIGFSLENDDGPLINDSSGEFTWINDEDEDWIEWMVGKADSEQIGDFKKETLDLRPLIELAAQAKLMIDSAL